MMLVKTLALSWCLLALTGPYINCMFSKNNVEDKNDKSPLAYDQDGMVNRTNQQINDISLFKRHTDPKIVSSEQVNYFSHAFSSPRIPGYLLQKRHKTNYNSINNSVLLENSNSDHTHKRDEVQSSLYNKVYNVSINETEANSTSSQREETAHIPSSSFSEDVLCNASYSRDTQRIDIGFTSGVVDNGE